MSILAPQYAATECIHKNYMSEKAVTVLKKLKKLLVFPLITTQKIGQYFFNPDTHLLLLEGLTEKIQRKTSLGVRLSTSDKILRTLTGKESKLFSHNDFIALHLSGTDDITKNQRLLLQSLFDKFPEKAQQKNVLFSRGGALSKNIWNTSGAGGVVHLDEKKRDNRNIVVNGNYGYGTEQFFYVHETIHHMLDLVKNNLGLEDKLKLILDKVNEEYEKSPASYEKIRNQMLVKYPQFKFYFGRMPFYGGTNFDELIAEAYSNPVFREYLKTITMPQGQNALSCISAELNHYFGLECFR